ncbi:unnamed protein product [Vicia faba]|uniref:Uncharacterized protein n=1 Tax=Vicia faba TaxID=3906 RepID=A0AAV0YNW9_VICFA|nr:unnamed protein product [Vicia faba]
MDANLLFVINEKPIHPSEHSSTLVALIPKSVNIGSHFVLLFVHNSVNRSLISGKTNTQQATPSVNNHGSQNQLSAYNPASPHLASNQSFVVQESTPGPVITDKTGQTFNPAEHASTLGPTTTYQNKTNQSSTKYNTCSDLCHYPKGNSHSFSSKDMSPEGNITPPVSESHNKSNSPSNSNTYGSFLQFPVSSSSPSINQSIPHVLLQNAYPMLNREKTGKSKPKTFMALTESEPTSVKQALTKCEWA